MVIVKVSESFVEGEKDTNEYGGMYYSFKGIPYARPPVGDLRFKAPQSADPWTGIWNAKEFGPVCYQFNFVNTDLINMSQNCLFINVYSPDIKPKKLLPVIFWIHGGANVWGSGNDDVYGPQFLVRHGVLLVTFNYRVEALGFLCLHTAEIPGNAGMKDQVAALKWVKKNIQNFGGDPENIAISGESSGAASVSYHLISQMSRGLFRRAIIHSGGFGCWWSQDFASRDKALLLAKQLGCFSEDDKIVSEFFKKAPLQSLVNLKLQVWKAQKSYEIHFGIADEKDFGQEKFFYGDVTDFTRNSVQDGVEILTGYTKDEGLIAIILGFSLEKMMNEAKYFNEFFVPRWIKTNCIIADQLEVGRKMREFYFKGADVLEDGVLKFLNMDFFTYGVYFCAKVYSRKNKVYYYKFTCFTERNFFGHIAKVTDLIKDKRCVCHADDLGYLFPVKFRTEKVDIESETFKCIENMTTLWTNFAKYGNPTPDNSLGVEWKPFTSEKLDYLEIGNKLAMKNKPVKVELEFWENIFREYLPKYLA